MFNKETNFSKRENFIGLNTKQATDLMEKWIDKINSRRVEEIPKRKEQEKKAAIKITRWAKKIIKKMKTENIIDSHHKKEEIQIDSSRQLCPSKKLFRN